MPGCLARREAREKEAVERSALLGVPQVIWCPIAEHSMDETCS